MQQWLDYNNIIVQAIKTYCILFASDAKYAVNQLVWIILSAIQA